MKAFPWRRGMTAIDEQGKRWLIVDNDGKNWSQCRPDPNDGATKGALLEAVREAFGDSEAHLIRLKTHDRNPENPMGDTISVLWWALADRYGNLIISETPDGFPKRLAGPTEFAALEAARQAAP